MEGYLTTHSLFCSGVGDGGVKRKRPESHLTTLTQSQIQCFISYSSDGLRWLPGFLSGCWMNTRLSLTRRPTKTNKRGRHLQAISSFCLESCSSFLSLLFRKRSPVNLRATLRVLHLIWVSDVLLLLSPPPAHSFVISTWCHAHLLLLVKFNLSQ